MPRHLSLSFSLICVCAAKAVGYCGALLNFQAMRSFLFTYAMAGITGPETSYAACDGQFAGGQVRSVGPYHGELREVPGQGQSTVQGVRKRTRAQRGMCTM